MTLYGEGVFSGEYPASSGLELMTGQFVIVHEFGAQADSGQIGPVNLALAEFVADHYSYLPIFASRSVANGLEKVAPELVPAGIFDGTSTTTKGAEGGTWAELMIVKEQVTETMERPIIVGQAFHVGRIALQAQKAGFSPLLPPNLPTIFDPESTQWWCRNKHAWALRELGGTVMLRRRGQI